MKERLVWLTTLLACMILTLATVGCSHQQTLRDSKGRPIISPGERALDTIEVENTFAKHSYYHQASEFCEEMKDIWVSENGKYAATAKWTDGGDVQTPYSMIKANYCTNHYKVMQQTLTKLSKTVPSVKDIPENIGAGMEWVMHTQETPIVEVAGDGKTAKGVWYSIGQAVRGKIGKNGKISENTQWMWEKYAVDFVKENGKWKIWHFINVQDIPPLSTGSNAAGPGGPPKGANVGTGAGGSRLISAKTVKVFKWSPTVVPRIDPKLPEPYYTFSETFSY